MRLIDADALVGAIVSTPSEVAQCHTYDVLSSLAERQQEILDMIEDFPEVEADPVVHGRWNELPSMAPEYECSECGRSYEWWEIDEVHYCPNCGAKMDGGAV